ncbi:MAG: permease [Fimbriimonadaceae bacterium]
MADIVHPLPFGSRIRPFALAALAVLAWWLVYSNLGAFSKLFAYGLLKLPEGAHLSEAVEFFVYEVPKVLLLLVLVVFAVGVVRTFFTPERTRAVLAGRRESAGNALGALLGTVTPFCSCSAVPLFIGFLKAGVPLGVTFSFLIAAPLVNEVALVMLFGLFGPAVALIYLSAGLTLATAAGWVIGRLRLERHVEPWVYEFEVGSSADERPTWSDRIRVGRDSVRAIVVKVWPFVVVGIAVGAGIHGYVPTGLMARYLGADAWWSVPLAVLLGVPMYSNAAGVIPIIQALIGKGAALGSALAFMMSVIALSLPEMVILRKVLRPRLIATFVGVVALGIVAIGFLFNSILPWLGLV